MSATGLEIRRDCTDILALVEVTSAKVFYCLKSETRNTTFPQFIWFKYDYSAANTQYDANLLYYNIEIISMALSKFFY